MNQNNEPTLTVSGISAAVAAIIALLVAFGLNLSVEQTAAIMGVVSVLAPIAVGVIARKFTVSLNRVAAYEPKDSNAVVAGPAAVQADGTAVVVKAKANSV